MRRFRIFIFVLLFIMLGLSAGSYYYRTLYADTTAPVLTSDCEELELSVTAGPDAIFNGLSAIDDRDGDITPSIMIDHSSNLIDENSIRVTYVVFDSSDNFSKLTRVLRYTDYEKPHFELREPLVYSMADPVMIGNRLKAVDVLDGDITGSIQLSTSDLSIGMEGMYSIEAQITNSLGDTVALPLRVMIVPGSRLPVIKLTDYLVTIKQGTGFAARDYIKSVEDPYMSEDDEPLTASDVHIIGAVDIRNPGVYYIQYTCDGAGGTGYTMLTVVVE